MLPSFPMLFYCDTYPSNLVFSTLFFLLRIRKVKKKNGFSFGALSTAQNCFYALAKCNKFLEEETVMRINQRVCV